MKKRILATILSVLLVVSLLPAAVFAQDPTRNAQVFECSTAAVLQEKMQQAVDGDVFRLTDDINIAGIGERAFTTFVQDSLITLDLNGHTINGFQGNAFGIDTSSALMIKNGAFEECLDTDNKSPGTIILNNVKVGTNSTPLGTHQDAVSFYLGDTTVWVVNNPGIWGLSTEGGRINPGVAALHPASGSSWTYEYELGYYWGHIGPYNFENPAPAMVGSGATWFVGDTLQTDFNQTAAGDAYKNILILKDWIMTADASLTSSGKILDMGSFTVTTGDYKLNIANTTGTNTVRNGTVTGDIHVTGKDGEASFSNLTVSGDVNVATGAALSIESGSYNTITAADGNAAKISISGGRYVVMPNVEYLADGYHIVQINEGDYKYKVAPCTIGSYTYAASGATITATGTCTNGGYAHKESALTKTLTLTPPADNRCTGQEVVCTIVYNCGSNWPGAPSAITYYQGGVSASPINPGTYVAKITDNSETAELTFTITDIVVSKVQGVANPVYGTAMQATEFFTVTATSSTPSKLEWKQSDGTWNETAPTGITAALDTGTGKITVATTAELNAGDYPFRVTNGEDEATPNFVCGEGVLTVDRIAVTMSEVEMNYPAGQTNYVYGDAVGHTEAEISGVGDPSGITLNYTYYKNTGTSAAPVKGDNLGTAAPQDAGDYLLAVSVSDSTGTYTGEQLVPFTVAPKALTADDIRIPTLVGTGYSLTPVVKYGNTELINGTDYTATYSPSPVQNTGNYTATITFKGNYSGGPVSKAFTVSDHAADPVTVSGVSMVYPGGQTSYTYGDTVSYTGTPSAVKTGTTDPVTISEYTYTYYKDSGTVGNPAKGDKLNGAPTAAGSYLLAVSVPDSNDDYTGEQLIPFTIAPKAMTDSSVQNIPDLKYTGNPLAPTVVVKDGEAVLTVGTDYDVAYSPAAVQNAGEYTATITFKGSYSGSASKTFTVIPCQPVTVSGVEMDYPGEQTDYFYGDTVSYTGAPAAVKTGTTDPVTISEYAYTYYKNTGSTETPVKGDELNAAPTAVGSYLLAVSVPDSNHDFIGEKLIPFTIARKAMTADSIQDIPPLNWTGNPLTPTVVVKDGEAVLTVGTDYDVAYSPATVKDAGNYTATITFKGNYSGSASKTFEVYKRLAADMVEVDGSGIVTVMDGVNPLIKDTHYTVTEDGNNIIVAGKTPYGGTVIVQKPDGKYSKSAEATPAAPVSNAKLDNALSELKEEEGIFTAEDKTAIDGGANAKVYLVIDETSATDEQKSEMTAKAAEANAGDELVFFDADLYKKVGTGAATPITEPGVSIAVTIVLPDELVNSDTAKMRTYKIVRLHGTTDILDASFDKATNALTFRSDKFSVYAIAFSDSPAPASGGYVTTYAVSVPSGVENGTLSTNKKTASAGQTVTITVTPDAGYQLDKLTVLDRNSREIEVKSLGDNKFSFKMPSGKVTVSATFRNIEADEPVEEPIDNPIDEPVETGVCPQDETCVYAKFSDADTKAWYHDGVHFCVENGYMKGISDTQFVPNGSTTRAMIVTILWRMEGEPVANYAMSFADVPADEWYAEAIRWAASEGIVLGYDDGTYQPNKAITREELAAILYRYAQMKGEGFVGASMFLMPFDDLMDISDWASESVRWCYMHHIILGRTETTFVPKATATRAEAATMMQRFCESFEK